jgi:hypothetical protein
VSLGNWEDEICIEAKSGELPNILCTLCDRQKVLPVNLRNKCAFLRKQKAFLFFIAARETRTARQLIK